MPLLDHFHSPVELRYPWESFHSSWATRLADGLNEDWLPPEFLAVENTHAGARLEIDVATIQQAPQHHAPQSNGPPVATAAPRVYTPPVPARVMPAVFPDSFEVRVYSNPGGFTLVGAIELISPGNKDRPDERRAFATKCASFLHQGVSVVIIDVVTNRRANLHNEIVRTLAVGDEYLLPAEQELYAVAYRPVLRQERPEIDLWTAPCTVGEPLPTLPLRLTGDLFVPVDFETAYRETCRRRRLS
jgi:Protein of unknown function (DUF4058)